ncbi:uncharacterized protein B0T15DRAFT_573940 [Chaetomium strumarium]|uniref:Uncharacterized protein n=1 Tax=Chaetomium strumarium TaxID=1170767 RepID=A0AAJ0GVX7_9PEZI|nr:hypothetical protein B0T15DRAFT_573940 [Chaetomium strumarium]
MKTLALLLSAGLVSARVNLPNQIGINSVAGINLNLSDGSNIGNAQGLNLSSFKLVDLDLHKWSGDGGPEPRQRRPRKPGHRCRDHPGYARKALLGQRPEPAKHLSFGFNNDVDLFLQIAQLMQLEQLGFVDLGKIHSLLNSGLVLGGFDLGVFKRENEVAKKTMKRTKLRRGQKVKRQCVTMGAPAATSAEEGIFTIATVPNPGSPLAATAMTATEDSAVATEASSSVAAATSASIAVAITASATSAVGAMASSTSVASAATSVAAAAQMSLPQLLPLLKKPLPSPVLFRSSLLSRLMPPFLWLLRLPPRRRGRLVPLEGLTTCRTSLVKGVAAGLGYAALFD